ncbi:MAG: hypothetical protein ACLQUY_19050 [Ktedonobacterales bacterium]
MLAVKRRAAVLLGFIVVVCSLLAACGVTSTGGTTGAAAPTPGATVVVHGTQATTTRLPSSTAVPAATAAATTATSGAVQLVLDKTAYAPGSTAVVTIENGLGMKITVTDHHTNCTYVQLEQQVAGVWQPVELCKSMTATLIVELSAGSVTPQKIGIPTGSGAEGTYRVMLAYNNRTAYSAMFTVA